MKLLDLIFPKKCLECGLFGDYICQGCLAKVRRLSPAKCEYSIFKYEGVIKKALIAIKYKFAFDIAVELSQVVETEIKKRSFLINKFELIPIPLHKKKFNFRGFNQVEIIGERVSAKMGWRYNPAVLVRLLNTLQQVGHSRFERLKNISGAFAVNNTHFIKNNSNILLFDDVYTTGATLYEAKKVLNQAGFKNIYILTIARG